MKKFVKILVNWKLLGVKQIHSKLKFKDFKLDEKQLGKLEWIETVKDKVDAVYNNKL